MPPEFAVTEQGPQAGHHVIAARGEIDLFTAPDLKQVLTDAIEGGEHRLVIDLSDVSFLDSTARIAKTFEITGLDQIFTILPSRDEALAALDDTLEGDAA